jgi:hypothetical protein
MSISAAFGGYIVISVGILRERVVFLQEVSE